MCLKNALPILCLLLATSVAAQQERGKNEVGVQVGGAFYTGDLAPDLKGSFKTGRPALLLHYNRIISPYFSLRANLLLGSLFGDDSLNEKPIYMRRRNFRFHSPLTEASLMAQFDVFGSNYSIPANRISPYVFAGVGASFINVHRDWSRIDTALIHTGSPTLAGLSRDNTTEMPKTLFVIPVGAGVKYHAWERIALTAEFNYRVTFTDYLDGFSYAANPERKDGYYSLTMGAVYNFGGGSGGRLFGGKGRGIGCPKVF